MLIRVADDQDSPILWAALAMAINWRDDELHMTPEQVREHPGNSRYLTGWPRDGEKGFVATDPNPVGAAWWRFFSADDPGYGFVAESVPEFGIGVTAERRGEGIGTALLGRLIEEARRDRLPGISLSVQLANPAIRLYQRSGFVVVKQDEGAATMVLSL